MARSLIKSKGRSESGSFIAVPKTLLESAEYAALSAHEVKLLLDLFAQYNGRNNGDFQCTWRLMRKRGWRSPDTLSRALKGLRERRWIQLTRQGGINRCSLYAVTWLPIDDCNGKLDCQPTKVAPGTWKIKTPIREAYPVTTGGVSMIGGIHVP